MCGIAVAAGGADPASIVARCTGTLHHRGPDAQGMWRSPTAPVAMGHTRLRILDLSEAGDQPMTDASERVTIVYNGEVYDHQELARDLGITTRTGTDTEVVLEGWARLGPRVLPKLHGMFAFVVWDEGATELVACRDRFGVKPLYWSEPAPGEILLASEPAALHAAGIDRRPDDVAWATWLATGRAEEGERTFWAGVHRLPAGALLRWRPGGRPRIERWYDLVEAVGPDEDRRDDAVVIEEYRALAQDAVRCRFESDVPVGINLSGGLDSSMLLRMVDSLDDRERRSTALTFLTGHDAYDEDPWVRSLLARSEHPWVPAQLRAEEVPELCASVAASQGEPFGGLPTLAYARLFEVARQHGVVVLLDGQGLDEQWAGYDYYARAGEQDVAVVQGGRSPAARPDCLVPAFAQLAAPAQDPAPGVTDPLRALQVRDLCATKIPRALRYNDRVSMRSSCELREPFLDHRLVELALRQPSSRKIRDGEHKWLLRRLLEGTLPDDVRTAPKRPVQTPQREWLRGPLRTWAIDQVEEALAIVGGTWLDPVAVRRARDAFLAGEGDHGNPLWQWCTIPLLLGGDASSSARMHR